MIELNLQLSPHLTFQEALLLGQKNHIHTLGLLLSYSTATKEQVQLLKKQINELALYYNMNVFLGFQLQLIPPALIPEHVANAKLKGFDYVTMAGEALFTDSLTGTNFAAVDAGVDILQQPGLIDETLAKFIKEKNVALEFNTNPKFSHTNSLIVEYALEYHIPLIWGSSIQEKNDFNFLAKRDLLIQACPKALERYLLKKINEDTFIFTNQIFLNAKSKGK